MKEVKISGEDQILMVDFINRLVEEAYTFDMEKRQQMVCMLHMMSKTAARE